MADDFSTTPWYHLENLVADNAVKQESPFSKTNLAKLPKASDDSSVFMQERGLLGHLVFRVDNPESSVLNAIKVVLSTDLPQTPLTSSYSDTASIYWVSPNEWLIVVAGNKTFEIESALRESLHGHYALVNVSGGQTILTLSGDNAINVLKKSSSYDFASNNFTVGKVVTTNVAESQALICKTDENTFDMVIRRSFADYIYAWLADAASEYGLATN